jgi:hypothetical protein
LRQIVSFFLVIVVVLVANCSCSLKQSSALPNIPDFLNSAMVKKIWIDSQFSKEEASKIIEAYRTIECSTGYSIIRFEFATNAHISDLPKMQLRPSILVIKTDSTDPRIIRSDGEFMKNNVRWYTVGLYSSNEPIPTVLFAMNRIKGIETFYRVAVHEGIHSAFNIYAHSESTSAIMNPNIDQTDAQDMSIKDLDFLCPYVGCHPVSLNVCKGAE